MRKNSKRKQATAPLRRLLMAPDTRARHRQISGFAGAPETLLDVGGSTGELAAFMPGTQIVTANVEPGGDVVFDGLSLPFADRAFDVAVSVDVLEHIQPPLRRRHLAELARVARQRIVLCCPLGGEAHEAAERELADWYERTTGARHRFLDEHIAIGLPDATELDALARETLADFELFYAGDFREANAMFRLTTELRRRPTPRRLARYLLALRRSGRGSPLQRAPSGVTNRVFLVGSPKPDV